jgi:uncharacterized repeat protein (TIGR03803 family)
MESSMTLLRKVPAILAFALCLTAATTAAQASSSVFSLLRSFCAGGVCTDGEFPSGTLVEDSDHNLFGTTRAGGENNAGVVFEFIFVPDKETYRYKRIYNFCAIVNCTDGSTPVDDKLVIDANGTIYGTASAGGQGGKGVVFELVPNAEHSHYAEFVIYDFCVTFSGCEDGSGPTGGLTFAGDATGSIYDGKAALYGTTIVGGRKGEGLAYSLVPSTTQGQKGTESQLYFFCKQRDPHTKICLDGNQPSGTMVVDQNGHLWGTTMTGGTNNAGLVFELTPPASGKWPETPVYSFCSVANCADGSTPMTGLIADSSGNFYGTAMTGGATYRKCPDTGCGVVFQLNGSGSRETTLYTFCTLAPQCADGGVPAGLTIDPNGNLYGATTIGAVHHNGGFYKLGSGTLTDLYDVRCPANKCTSGQDPSGSLLLNANDDLYGVFTNGGRNGEGGTVFKVTP